MKLILVRHGETDLNRDGRILGLTDASLNATGRAQARAVATPLAAELPFQMYSSPLVRAVETAQIVTDALEVTATPNSGLQEADAGDLDGLKASETRERFPEFTSRWDRDAATARMPGGESLLQVQQRSWSAVTRLADAHPDETTVAVTHNFVIRAIVCKALGIELRNFRRLRNDLGSITRLDLTQSHGVLLSMNDTSHLRNVGTQRE
jgi:broad specificity phosphatase PhoE